jgi:hypothetical protein
MSGRSGRQHWVFFQECGCPFGLLEDAGYTKAGAWRDFYDEGTSARTERAIGKAVARGVSTELVEHATYIAEFLPKMLGAYVCPHALSPSAVGGEPKATPPKASDLGGGP